MNHRSAIAFIDVEPLLKRHRGLRFLMAEAKKRIEDGTHKSILMELISNLMQLLNAGILQFRPINNVLVHVHVQKLNRKSIV